MPTMKSMTGFGRYTQNTQDIQVLLEVRSVNSRVLDIKWRLPNLLRSHENIFEKIVRKHAIRGRVEISIVLQENTQMKSYMLNETQANTMLFALDKLAKERGDTYVPDYNCLLAAPHVWSGNDNELSEEFIGFMENALVEALNDWNHSRELEAAELFDDLQKRFKCMQEWMVKIKKSTPIIKEQRFQSVRERLQEVLRSLESNLDDSRFLQEMVILSDKLDVSEECTRLDSHFKRLFDLLDNGIEVGRKLDFTLQECFREINTCGNKVQDAEISILVVEFKNELEKCREQVQNIE